jgi:hypothetical protein
MAKNENEDTPNRIRAIQAYTEIVGDNAKDTKQMQYVLKIDNIKDNAKKMIEDAKADIPECKLAEFELELEQLRLKHSNLSPEEELKEQEIKAKRAKELELLGDNNSNTVNSAKLNDKEFELSLRKTADIHKKEIEDLHNEIDELGANEKLKDPIFDDFDNDEKDEIDINGDLT